MKRINLIIVLISISIGTFSQIINRIGIKSGFSNSTLDWEYINFGPNPFNFQNNIGLSTQIFMDLLNLKNINISPNIGYIKKGALDKVDFVTPNGDPLGTKLEKYTLDYLAFDIQIKYKKDFLNILSYLSIGPRFDYLMNASILLDGIDLNNLNYGLKYCIGSGYNFNKAYIFIELNNNYNLNKIADYIIDKANNVGVKIKDKTMTFNIGVSIKINED